MSEQWIAPGISVSRPGRPEVLMRPVTGFAPGVYARKDHSLSLLHCPTCGAPLTHRFSRLHKRHFVCCSDVVAKHFSRPLFATDLASNGSPILASSGKTGTERMGRHGKRLGTRGSHASECDGDGRPKGRATPGLPDSSSAPNRLPSTSEDPAISSILEQDLDPFQPY